MRTTVPKTGPRSTTRVTEAVQEEPLRAVTSTGSPAGRAGRRSAAVPDPAAPQEPGGEAAGFPAGDGLLWRCGELLVEGVGDQPAQPVGDIDVAFGAPAPEAVAQGGIDAHLEDLITFHVMTS